MSDFFAYPEPEPEPDPPVLIAPPPWAGPPSGSLAAPTELQLVIAANERAAVAFSAKRLREPPAEEC